MSLSSKKETTLVSLGLIVAVFGIGIGAVGTAYQSAWGIWVGSFSTILFLVLLWLFLWITARSFRVKREAKGKKRKR